jgi:hypothetical protein
MFLLWSVVISVVTGAPSQGFRINKCCSEDQALTTDYRCTGYKNSPWDSNTEVQPWLIAEVAVGSRSLSDFHLNIQYGSQATCEGRQHVVFAEDADLFSLREDGALILYDEDYVRNTTFPEPSFCFDRLLLQESQQVNVILLCPCNTMTCIRKCCPSGSFLNENLRCVSDDTNTVRHTPFLYDSSKYFQLTGLPRCTNGGVYLSHSVSSPNDTQNRYRFLDDGRVEGDELRNPIPVEEYCWDATIDGNGSDTQTLLYCKRRESRERRVLYGVMILIGAGFLLATLLVYAVLPELRNGLHAKYLMAHTASFLVAYLFLGAGQLLPVAHYATCTAVGEMMIVLHTLDLRGERSVKTSYLLLLPFSQLVLLHLTAISHLPNKLQMPVRTHVTHKYYILHVLVYVYTYETKPRSFYHLTCCFLFDT